MPFPASKRKRTMGISTPLNIVPVMNLFTALIPFLLLCAVFASTTILELYLPPGQEEGGVLTEKATEKEGKVSLTLTVAITKKGFRIGGTGTILPLIPKIGNKYNYSALKEQLEKVKEVFPQQEEIIVLSEPQIIYDLIIQVMDVCYSCNFPNISLAASIE